MTMPPAMNETAITRGVVYSTRLTTPENSAPAAAAGRNATNSISTKWRASGSDGSPASTRAIFARYSQTIARIEPSWIRTVNTPPGSSNPRRRSAISRWAVDETGRNSVSPCTTPNNAAAIQLISTERPHHDARRLVDLPDGFPAGAPGAAGATFTGARPSQMTTIAAAMNTLE